MSLFRGLERNCAFALVAAVACLAVPAMGQTDATWTAAGDGNYSAAGNWNIGVVPLNDGNTYNVYIPGTGTVYFDVDAPSSITDLTLAAGRTLVIKPGHSLRVLDDASISGTITAAASLFLAQSPGAAFAGNTNRLAVSGGARSRSTAPHTPRRAWRPSGRTT